MFNITKSTKNYSVDEVMQVMQEDINKYGIFIDIENAYYNFYYYCKIMNDAMIRLKKIYPFEFNYSTAGESLKPSSVTQYAIDKKFNAYLGMTQKGSISLSENSISSFLNKIDSYDLENKEEIKEVMSLYLKYSNAKYLSSSLNGESSNYIRLPKAAFLSYDKHSVGVVRPTCSAQNTGRISMSNPNISGISNDLEKPIMCVPEDFVMVVVDMGQVDPILFINLILQDDILNKLVLLYNDAYYAMLHYCTISDVEVSSGNLVKREITEEMKEQRRKIKILTNATIYGKHIIDEDPLSLAFKTRLSMHPNRQRLVKECEAKLNAGQTIFETYLGSKIDVTKTDDRSVRMHGEDDLQNARLRKAVNAQIQGLTADVLRHAYMEIRNYLKENCSNSLILTQVYDSLKFMIHKSEVDKVKDYINNCLAFRIEGYEVPVNCEATWFYNSDKREEFTSNV